MAVQMINSVLNTESKAATQREKTKIAAQQIIENANKKAKEIHQTAVSQAKEQAEQILKDAKESADGILQNADKLASMRKKKTIADTEKKYDSSIKIVIDNLI